MRRSPLILLFAVFLFVACGQKTENDKKQVDIADNFETPIQIPIWENSWGWNKADSSFIKERSGGVSNGQITLAFPDQAIKTYVHVKDTGDFHLALKIAQVKEDPTITVSLGKEYAELPLDETFKDTVVQIGTFHVDKPGYQEIDLGFKNHKGEGSLGNISVYELLVGGAATKGEVNFVKDNFHFGRRGPSVHLRYPIPEKSKKPLYFYNEVTVPEGEDVIGSYFMADGFSHGYFGMQVNSEKERRVLFSVWSPYKTDDPNEIPEDKQIKLLKKGEGVHAGEFGNEGSGGQSYKKVMWDAGKTYKFLLKGEPDGENFTDYTAYFLDPDEGDWQLIASFKRPEAGNYLGDLYSFLENFAPATGAITREGEYKNQWLYDEEEGWLPLNKAVFTADATANKGDRLDYAGGEVEGGYFLKNAGFFNETTPVNTEFERAVEENAPEVDFEALP